MFTSGDPEDLLCPGAGFESSIGGPCPYEFPFPFVYDDDDP